MSWFGVVFIICSVLVVVYYVIYFKTFIEIIKQTFKNDEK